jgi:prepilin-type N-terminal cleavage/methylation domain-containing protein
MLPGRISRAEAFTLIELMIVVAIIGILATIAIPKFASLVLKSKEGSTKGSLGAIRSALTIYYSDLEGQYPSAIGSLTTSGKYMSTIPTARTPDYHIDSSSDFEGSSVCPGGTCTVTDGAGWGYDNTFNDQYFGYFLVNCTHTDSKGTIWSNY